MEGKGKGNGKEGCCSDGGVVTVTCVLSMNAYLPTLPGVHVSRTRRDIYIYMLAQFGVSKQWKTISKRMISIKKKP